VLAVVRGLARACREVGAALLGGETAQMPDTYLPGVIDVAGCMIGWVRPEALRDGGAVRPGDVVLGLASTGLHTNGFSLARRVLASLGLGPADPLPGASGMTLGDALLAPHRWYGPALEGEIARGRVHALAHVTGGGIAGNLVRVLPPGCRARIDAGTWPRPEIFRWLCRAGDVPEDDARDAFNLGLGMLVVCPGAEAAALAEDLGRAGETVYRVGAVSEGVRGVEWVA
jgi:phosphoribosylformylglycinamidine cyclo-ligase